MLTLSVSESPFDSKSSKDFRVLGVSRAQLSCLEFIKPEWLLPLNSILHILFFYFSFTVHIQYVSKRLFNKFGTALFVGFHRVHGRRRVHTNWCFFEPYNEDDWEFDYHYSSPSIVFLIRKSVFFLVIACFALYLRKMINIVWV